MSSLVRLLVALVAIGGSVSRAHARSSSSASDVMVRKKVAIFAFDGDGADVLHEQVVRLFRANRMDVATNLRAPDRSRYVAEQFRDMGAALDLSVYVQGRIKNRPADRALAIITLRSGVTGQTIATARFEGARQTLPGEVREKLWKKVHRAVTRACSDANRGHRRHNKPTRIEAGTPL